MSAAWSLEQAEEHLLSLELFGMRFGLERMRRLLTALGSPQERFAAVHVVGTNGKSSTVRMTAALLEAHDVRTGAYLSPHLGSFAERIRIGDEDLAPDAFGAAVQRAAAAAAKVDRTLSGGERVTQFELLTAAAYDELARRGVEVAVVEAGPGRALGRHQRARRRRGRAHQRRAGAHALARPDGAPTSRVRSWPSCGRRRPSCWATSTTRCARWPRRPARGSSAPPRRTWRCPASSARTSAPRSPRRASRSARSIR